MISVIVPVYKVEKYIHACIESILKQSFRDYELILVNDGSPDNCPSICDEYANRYDYIRVLHKENGGLSDARNAGTNIAKGQFVTYVDSDDIISVTYLETLNRLIMEYNADIAVTGIKILYKNKSLFFDSRNHTDYIYTGIEALENMLYQNTLDTSACAMLLPINIAKLYPFPYGRYHEDEFTTYKYYLAVNKVAVTDKKEYFYVQRNDSIMHTFGQACIDELEAADNLVKICEENHPELVSAANSKKFSDYCQVFLSTSEIKNKNEIYQRITSFLLDYRCKIVCDKKARVKNRLAGVALLGGSEFLTLMNQIINRHE